MKRIIKLLSSSNARSSHSSVPLPSPSPYPCLSEKILIGSDQLILETGKIAQFGKSSAMMSTDCMSTSILSTVCARYCPFNTVSKRLVDYIEEPFSRGESQDIPEIARERKDPDRCSRLMEIAIKKLIHPRQWKNLNIQVTTTALSIAGNIDAGIIAVNATSTALALSGLSWDGPVGAVKIAMIDGKPVAVANALAHKDCLFELTYVGTMESVIISEFKYMDDVNAISKKEEEEEVALKLARSEAIKLIEAQNRLKDGNKEAKEAREEFLKKLSSAEETK